MNPSQAAIELDNLTFNWPSSKRPIIDIGRFSLAPAEKLFLRGPSGSGKTTLLSLIAGINTATTGSLKILSTDLSAMPHGQRDQFRADHIGFIFQMFNLIPYLNVIDNVLLPLRFSTLRKSRCTDSTSQARELLNHLGLCSDTLLRSKPTELSVGQQQRVAAARALIGKPDIVIADEPTSALDTDNRGQFIELLMKECASNGAALLFVSHDAELASHFDRHVDLADLNRVEATVK